MNDSEHPFDPALQPVFFGYAGKDMCAGQQHSRDLFYYLIHIGEHIEQLPAAYHYIQHHLSEATDDDQTAPSPKYHPAIFDLQFDCPGPSLSEPLQNRANLENCLLQCAPVILTTPCWLRQTTQAATSQEELATKLMAVFLKLDRSGHGKSNLHDLYLALLLNSGVDIPTLHTRAFARQNGVLDCLYDFAALQLALACHPRAFFAEILGFTLAYCQSPALIEQLFSSKGLKPDHALTRFFTLRRDMLVSQTTPVIQIIKFYLQLFEKQADSLWVRVQTGFRLYQQQNECCHHQLRDLLEHPLAPQQRMEKLFKEKAAAAFGHHHAIQLGGKSLDDWFAKEPFDSRNFLAALKHSPYIDSRNPADSRLLKLFDFKGPMFGVLNPSERALLETWLTDDEERLEKADPLVIRCVKKTPDFNSTQIQGSTNSSDIDFAALKNRELYYYLLNADLTPEVLYAAKDNVQKILKGIGLFHRPPFKYYQHQRFEEHIQNLYRQETQAYQPLKKTPRLSKQAYRWGIEQFAPTVLTDGCWLQDINQLQFFSNHAVGDILFGIYCDEIGNGIRQQNHPYIYRQLLNSLEITLPAVHTREFSEHGGFIDSAFDLPVYLMSIAKFPSTFLPEILGLNLAIELSGLGRVYCRLVDELKFWGIDPTIVSLHISIDNISSGHAAQAVKAIQLYQDDIAAGLGQQEMHRHWQRVHTGYCSLDSVSRKFKFALVYRYLFATARSYLTKKQKNFVRSLEYFTLEK